MSTVKVEIVEKEQENGRIQGRKVNASRVRGDFPPAAQNRTVWHRRKLSNKQEIRLSGLLVF